MKRPRHLFILLSFLLGLFFTAMAAQAFDRQSFSRQQSQADSGFDELDEEFKEPVVPPKVIIKEKVIEKVIIEEKLVPAPPVAVAPAPKVSNTAFRTQSANGYLFTLKGCALSNRNIECNLSVVREKDDGVLALRAQSAPASSIFDSTGNQFHPDSISLGSERNGGWVKSRLIRGITSKINIYFSNVSSETLSIALLEVTGHDYNSDQQFNLQFRDVAFR